MTYEGFAAAWPSREGEFADKFNSMPKYVVSSTLEDPEWTNSTVLDGDLAEEVAKLKQEHDGDIVVHGSAAARAGAARARPRRRAAADGLPGRARQRASACSARRADKKPLRLADSKIVGDGVAILVYQPAAD